MLAGALIASLWSFRLVDSVIGDNVANTLLGYDAKHTEIGGLIAGTVFAFVSGLAGTFTACNIAAFGAIAPMTNAGGARPAGSADTSGRLRIGATLRPIGWLALGMIVVPEPTGPSAPPSASGCPSCRPRRPAPAFRRDCCRLRSSSA
ncbi:hypothetical protein [Streptosporangium roseum]|uniref:hypothetical protein n=1 Tax=Streptosporangium roseum TaxID=2001 RepID=UPI0012DC1E97|nr:hypothetical protein [Streptosporangium roseum]